MKKINVFDLEYQKIINLTIRIGIITLGIITILFLLLIFIKKDKGYHNNIVFVDNQHAYIVMDKDLVNDIKLQKEVWLNEVKYDFIIDKIEKKNNIYLGYISFSYELNLDVNTYQIILGKERLLNYILRVMKG